MPRNNYFTYHTPCNVEDLNKLQDELIALDISIKNVVLIGQTLNVRSQFELSLEQKNLVDSTIANFDDIDLSLKVPKIYDYVNPEVASKHHHDINYRTELKTGQTLIPKRTVVKGEVTGVDWYRTIDQNQSPIDLILKVRVTYYRDVTGFATYRVTTRTWINRDDSENIDIKITPKYYFVNPTDMITEGFKRRKLLVSSVQIPTMTFMTEVLMPLGYTQESVVLQGRAFMDVYETLFSKFEENSSTVTDPADPNFGKKNIIVALEDNTPTGINGPFNLWLDKAPAKLGGTTTIRQYLISEFSI